MRNDSKSCWKGIRRKLLARIESAMTLRKFTILAFATVVFVRSCPLEAQLNDPDMNQLSVRQVEEVVEVADWVIVDTRSTDAYNGWKLDGVSRGGHLPNAVDFPASWLDSGHRIKTKILKAALTAKGIAAAKNIVLYGTNQRDRNRVADYFRKEGCRKIYEFDFLTWVDDPSKPLVRYENFHLLLPAVIIKQLLDGKSPETFASAKQIKFVEVSWGNEAASYAKGHVPRSFHVNTDHFEPPPTWKLGSPATLDRFAQRYGFQANDTVVLSSEDPTASYRLAIVLTYMGVEDVRVLNGGFAAWKREGYPVETTSNPPPQSTSFGAQIPRRANLIAGTPQVKTVLQQPSKFTLVDTRTWNEFIGKTSGYKTHFHKGRIPGSVYAQADFRGADSLEPYRNIDNTMRNADEIQALWNESGISTERHLLFMCGGGWRAAEVLTFAHVMGLSNTSLYSDGWIGWSNDGNNPVETGQIKNRDIQPK